MFHYLRTKDDHCIVDVEPYIRDGNFEFTGGVCNIGYFLDFYDGIPANKRDEFKEDFESVDAMRGWFFENYLPSVLKNEVSEDNLGKAHKTIEKILTNIANKYDLNYGSD